jgi:Glycosyl hydrolase family 26
VFAILATSLACASAGCAATPADGSSGSRSLPAATVTAPITMLRPDVVHRRKVGWGLFVPGFPPNVSALTQVEREVGANADYVMWYAHWGGAGSAFDVASVQAVIDGGATPIISWMSDGGGTADTFPTHDIAAGRFDAYIESWAQGLREIAGTVIIRFDFEMNGNWFPWDEGIDGQTSRDYIAAWRHVHDVFVDAGVTNVRWMWSPNVAFPGSTPIEALYPGNAYVDWVGVDGYNFGPSVAGHTWRSPSEVFAATISSVEDISLKPVMLSEVGCASVGGDKAAWIAGFFKELIDRPDLQAFTWFDAATQADFRIDSSATSVAQFAHGLRELAAL